MLDYKEFCSLLPADKDCINFYIRYNYRSVLACSKCGSHSIHPRNDHPKVLQCKSCKSQVSILSGTLFEKSSTDLNKWLYAIYKYFRSKKKLSATELQSEICVTYKTAWRILNKVKHIRQNEKISLDFLRAIVNITSRYCAESNESL